MTKENQGLATPKRQRVKLSDIHTRPDIFQYREAEYDNYHVEELKEALQRKNDLERFDLWRDPTTGELVVLDGHHRFEAYKRAGMTSAPVKVYEGTEDEARLHALRANTSTKLPMTATEKTNAAWRLVCHIDDSGSYVYSKRQIVMASGAADGTVGKMRRTRKELLEADKPIPEAWWAALAALKDEQGRELTDDDVEAMIEERARRLDDRVGKDIAAMAEVQIEAVARMLEKRCGQKVRFLADWWQVNGLGEEEDMSSWPF